MKYKYSVKYYNKIKKTKDISFLAKKYVCLKESFTSLRMGKLHVSPFNAIVIEKIESTDANLDPRALLLTEGQKGSGNPETNCLLIGFREEQSKVSLISAFMLARGVTRRRKVPNNQFLAARTLRRMFSYIEFPRALGRSKALVTRMH